jgi:hypothetical protein
MATIRIESCGWALMSKSSSIVRGGGGVCVLVQMVDRRHFSLLGCSLALLPPLLSALPTELPVVAKFA